MADRQHRPNHLLAHLQVGCDSDRALRYRVIGELAVPAEDSVVLRARLPRHRRGTVVAGEADVALVRLRPLQDAFVGAFAQLRAHAQVHLLVAALDVVRALRHRGIHVEICVALADGTHQNIICLVARFFHLLVRADQLVIVRFGDELEIGLVLILEAHHVRLMHCQLPIWREALALIA